MLSILIVFSQMIVQQHWKLYLHIAPHFVSHAMHISSDKLKILFKKIQTAIEILQNNRELSRKKDAIKIHSLIHNQLSAPVFNAMIKYF